MRVGLKPVLRRVWAPRGRRPVARVRRRYEWAYVYGFVRPRTGEVFWLVMPTVNTGAFSLALSRFAEWVGGAGEGKKRVVLVLDRAGWHVAKDLKVPEGLHLEFLPARSPELQPAERLWPLVNERVANRPFENLDELEGALWWSGAWPSPGAPTSSGTTRATDGGRRRREAWKCSAGKRMTPGTREASSSAAAIVRNLSYCFSEALLLPAALLGDLACQLHQGLNGILLTYRSKMLPSTG
jgi:hypothetical protein